MIDSTQKMKDWDTDKTKKLMVLLTETVRK